NFHDGNADSSDVLGHGTEVASVAAARTNNALGIAGACGRCSILPVRVTDSSGFATFTTLASAIVWATDHGARVISISIIGYVESPELANAVAYAQQRGALIVAAAGNDRLDHPGYPAALPGVIS